MIYLASMKLLGHLFRHSKWCKTVEIIKVYLRSIANKQQQPMRVNTVSYLASMLIFIF